MSNEQTDKPSQPANNAPLSNKRVTLWLTWWAIVVGLTILMPNEFVRLREAIDADAGWASWLTSINLDTTLPFACFLLLPLFWFIRRRKPYKSPSALQTWFGAETKPHPSTSWADIVRAVALAVFVGIVSWSMSARIGATPITVNTPYSRKVIPLSELPPALHDEYSYLFQAGTFLAGRLAFPSAPRHPELFDQMHVLNDNDVYAGRYFPGTAFWMAPFVALGKPYWGHWLAGASARRLCFLSAVSWPEMPRD